MLYVYHITPASPLRTPLMSDTFFGHFCWAMLYQQGENYLREFLDFYGNGKLAPILFSSAFLSGYLPRPDFPPPGGETAKKFVFEHFGKEKKQVFEGLLTIKDWNKHRLVSSAQWGNLKNNYSDIRLYEDFVTKHQQKPENSDTAADTKYSEIEVIASNMIDRSQGTIFEDGLFHKQKIWYHKHVRLDLYVEINAPEMTDAVHWFLTDFLPENGFGADKSVGMGELSIVQDETFDSAIFEVENANSQLCLSLTSFSGMEAYDAFYCLKTKFGKLGGTFAFSNPSGGNPKPFKKPILMYEPGAVFLCTDALNDKPLLENIHSDTRIRHCGIPITLPLRIEKC